MRLEGRTAVVYGAAGPMGSAAAQAFGAEGARLFLAGRTGAKVEQLASTLASSGVVVHAAEVDVDDRAAVDRHADDVLRDSGRIDISFNAVGTDDVQGIPLVDISVEDFMTPITQVASRHLITATAAARVMTAQGFGAIVMLTSSASKEWRHQMGGFSVACASVEVLTRALAGELAGTGVRANCIRANFTPETHSALPAGATDALVADTLIGRLPRLSEVAAAAVYLGSDESGATTGAVLDLTAGAIVN